MEDRRVDFVDFLELDSTYGKTRIQVVLVRVTFSLKIVYTVIGIFLFFFPGENQ